MMVRITAIIFSLAFWALRTPISSKCSLVTTKLVIKTTKIFIDKEMTTRRIIKLTTWTILRQIHGYEGERDSCRQLIIRRFVNICSIDTNLSDLSKNGWLIRTTEKLFDLRVNLVLTRTLGVWFSWADRQIWTLPISKPSCKPIQSTSCSKILSRLIKSYDQERFKWIKTKHGDTHMVSCTGTTMQCCCREN